MKHRKHQRIVFLSIEGFGDYNWNPLMLFHRAIEYGVITDYISLPNKSQQIIGFKSE